MSSLTKRQQKQKGGAPQNNGPAAEPRRMTVSRDHYYLLASDIEAERIQAAVALINELAGADSDEEWDYALRRLIKGLSSSRASARLGFSTCLTEIVNVRVAEGKLTVQQLIGQINEHNKVASSMNGREERAVLFGRLFGLQCLSNANSGVFSAEVDPENFKLFVDNLVELSCTKSWIREPSLFTVFTLLRSLYAKLSDDLILYVFTKLDENKLALTTEGLAIFLAIPPQFRSKKLSAIAFKNSTWKNADPLHKSNLSLLTKVLKDISTEDDADIEEDKSKKANSKQKGSWSPRLHFVWSLIVDEFVKSSADAEDEQVANSRKRKKSSEKKSKKSKSSSSKAVDSESLQVAEFWKIIIDEGFFSEKASHERKYWGFEVFGLFFQQVQPEIVSTLFTKNFMRTLINQSSDQSRMLNKIAKKTLTLITDTCKHQPLKTVPVLESILIGPSGNLYFDKLTKSKTTELLIGTDAPNSQLAQLFIQALDKHVEDEQTQIKNQKWAIDQLLHLVRAKKSKLEKSSDLEWIDSILKALVQRAYIQTGEKKEKKTDDDEDMEEEEQDPIVEFAQERLNSIMSDVISIERTDNQTWSYKTLNSLLDLIEQGATPIFNFDEELETVKAKSLKILKKIRSKRESQHSDNSRLLVFELLFSMVVLQLFSGDSESVNTLQELQEYYYGTKKEEEEDHDKVLGIVEILLNFLSQNSSLLKKLSLIIWENWCDKVNAEGLQLLYDVIVTKENSEGQRALFEGEGEFVDEDEDEEHNHSHDEEDDDEEEEEDEDEDEDDDDDDEEEDDDSIEEVEKKTNVALAEALRIPHNGEVVLSSDDEDDFSDESMDDEQMMAIDDHLSKIFQQRREALDTVQTGNKRKQEKIVAKESIVLFKHRIVDLLEAYAKKCPESELILTMVSPLLTAMKITLDKSLGIKIHKLLKNRVCKCKVANISEINREELLEQLKKMHKDVLRTSNTNDFNLSSSQCSIFLSKQLIQADESAIDEVIDLYSDLMKQWFKKKNSRLTSSMFFDFINWMNSKRSN